MIVIKSPWDLWEWLFSIIPWWDQVIVIPEANKIAVLRRGICIGLNGLIPKGGHIFPISIEGDNLLWKKAQKKDTKKRTSDVIKRIIPQRRPVTTKLVWSPWKVPSREISRHHWYAVVEIIKIPNKKRFILYRWNHLIIPEVRVKSPAAIVNGQGLKSTKW